MNHPVDPFKVLIIGKYPEANSSCRHFPSFSPTTNCRYPGWCLEILDVFLRSGNISHEFIIQHNTDTSTDFGKMLPNGTFTGLLGQMQEGHFDTVCLMYQKSVNRLAHFDFSVEVAQIRPTFIVREIPVTLSSLLFSCLRPYDGVVWISILGAILIQMLVWSIIGRVEVELGVRKERGKGESYPWEMVDEFLNSAFHPFVLHSGVLVRLIFSVFQVGLLPSMYTAALLTSLLTPSDNSPLKSSADAIRLIKSGRYTLISDGSQWFAQDIGNSQETLFVELRTATAVNKIVQPASDEEALALVAKGDYIFQTQDDSESMPMVQSTCYTFLFSEGLTERSAHFIFRPNNPWLPIINEQIMRSYPLIDSVYSRYFRDREWTEYRPKCPPDKYVVPRAEDPLNFWSVFGVFALTGMGFLVGIIFLFIEFLWFTLSQYYVRRREDSIRKF